MLAGPWRIEAGGVGATDPVGCELAIAPDGDALSLRWSAGPLGALRQGCGIAVGDWIYAARTPVEALHARLPTVAGAEYDARTGIITFDLVSKDRWPVLFYHPRDAGRCTASESGAPSPNAPEGRFTVGYTSQRGGTYDGITQTITREGARFFVTWEKGGTLLYEGVGLNLGPRFAVAWGRPGFDHEVIVLAAKATCGERFVASVRTSMRASGVISERYRLVGPTA